MTINLFEKVGPCQKDKGEAYEEMAARRNDSGWGPGLDIEYEAWYDAACQYKPSVGTVKDLIKEIESYSGLYYWVSQSVFALTIFQSDNGSSWPIGRIKYVHAIKTAVDTPVSIAEVRHLSKYTKQMC